MSRITPLTPEEKQLAKRLSLLLMVLQLHPEDVDAISNWLKSKQIDVEEQLDLFDELLCEEWETIDDMKTTNTTNLDGMLDKENTG